MNEVELRGKDYQHDWKTKTWRSLAGDLIRGSYLQGAAAEFLPQEKTILPAWAKAHTSSAMGVPG